MTELEEWLQLVGGEYPVAVGGDFDISWYDCPTVRAWRTSGETRDLHEGAPLKMQPTQEEPTWRGATHTSSTPKGT